jgi:hypothetical protein
MPPTSFSFDAQLIWESDPIPEIQKYRDKSDWFQAIVYSAIQLERFGYFAIRENIEHELKDKNSLREIDKVLNRMYLRQISDFLLGIGRINKEEHKTIITINEARNTFMHQRELKKYVTGKKAEDRYKPLVNEAIRILKDKLDAEIKRLP